MSKNHYFIISGLVLAGTVLAGSAQAQVINWGGNFTNDTLDIAASFVTMFNDPLLLIVGVMCAVIGIGAVIGYLKH